MFIVGDTGVHEATPVGAEDCVVQCVLVKELLELAASELHANTAVGGFTTSGQVVAV